MYEEQYLIVGQVLKPYQSNLTHRLSNAVDAYHNIDPNQYKMHQLVHALVEAYFAFLFDWKHNTPTHLGEDLNQIRATPIFLAGINKTIRQFCLTCLKDIPCSDKTHSESELLIAGLEATADFFAHLVQAYVQINQGMLKIEAIRHQEKLKLRSSLTDFESNILQHLAQGKTNRQIAAAMEVSERTIVNHLKQARQKLGTHNRPDTLIMAVKLFNL